MKRVALITGAAGGIGSATARVFADAGWYVVGTDRRRVEDVPGVARFVQADIADPAAVEGVFQQLAGTEGRLDALVNNAAVQLCKPIMETTTEEWDLIMASNVRAAFLTARAGYMLLKAAGGAVVNVSSVHAIATTHGLAAYAASKGALVALTRAMALELGRDGIRVNCVLPGAVDTPMLHANIGRGHVQPGSVDELVRGLGKQLVMGRVGLPEEIAEAILFLGDSERSAFVTGQTLVVDGGATARLSTQ